MSKIPKAKCEKCGHCKMVKKCGDVFCEILNREYHTERKPERCIHFKKRKNGGDTDA